MFAKGEPLSLDLTLESATTILFNTDINEMRQLFSLSFLRSEVLECHYVWVLHHGRYVPHGLEVSRHTSSWLTKITQKS